MTEERKKLIARIEAYEPSNEQEERDKPLILDFLREKPDAFLRSNLTGHMTASSWAVNRKRDKVLLIWHNIYKSWSWSGGHADGDENLLHVAMKELGEETGVKNMRPVQDEIFSLEILSVPGHEKHGQYVPSHLHYNLSYLIECDEADELHICADENSGVKWFSFPEAIKASTEPWFVERIYKKLNTKLINKGL